MHGHGFNPYILLLIPKSLVVKGINFCVGVKGNIDFLLRVTLIFATPAGVTILGGCGFLGFHNPNF